MPEVAGRGRCWLRSPWGAGRVGLQEGWRCCWCTGARRPWHWGRVSCHTRGTVCASLSPLMSGKKCESSPVLPSSPGRRCPHPALLLQEQGRVPRSKKAFFLLAQDGRQPGQAAQLLLAPSDTHSSVARLSLCWSVGRHCHQNILQGCLGSCHLPVAANPHPRGSSLPSNRCQCLQARPG